MLCCNTLEKLGKSFWGWHFLIYYNYYFYLFYYTLIIYLYLLFYISIYLL